MLKVILFLKKDNVEKGIFTLNLSPNWFTGFVDGKSSFSVDMTKNSKYKKSWSIIPAFAIKSAFTIKLKDKDLPLLLKIQSFCDIGKIQYIEKKKVMLCTL